MKPPVPFSVGYLLSHRRVTLHREANEPQHKHHRWRRSWRLNCYGKGMRWTARLFVSKGVSQKNRLQIWPWSLSEFPCSDWPDSSFLRDRRTRKTWAFSVASSEAKHSLFRIPNSCSRACSSPGFRECTRSDFRGYCSPPCSCSCLRWFRIPANATLPEKRNFLCSW